jgi:hypothetical protein
MCGLLNDLDDFRPTKSWRTSRARRFRASFADAATKGELERGIDAWLATPADGSIGSIEAPSEPSEAPEGTGR